MIPITGLWAPILYILFARNVLANNGDSSERPPDAPFDWLKLESSRKLNYVPCSTDLQFRCARLEVPLDWLNVTDKRTVAIAVRTLPAKVPFDHPTFSGSIIVNPGGPGASGTQFIESIGREIQEWFDKPGTRHYEIVSFDPRGVAPTTLTAYCFKNDKQRTHWQLAHQGVGGPLSGVHGPLDADKMGQALAAQDAYMRQCRDAEGELGQSMAHISTANVARDMLDLVDGIDELRRHSLNDSSEDSRDRTQINSKGRLPRLKYLGFSYGAFLGLTYASMFPGRVSRMILDGVVDPNDLVAERVSTCLPFPTLFHQGHLLK
jgi:pimeloyl-ACP methyl ester carboxylesterase